MVECGPTFCGNCQMRHLGLFRFQKKLLYRYLSITTVSLVNPRRMRRRVTVVCLCVCVCVCLLPG